MESKVYTYEDQEVTVLSCLDENNVRFYYLITFLAIFGLKNQRSYIRTRLQNLQKNAKIFLRYLSEFNVSSVLPENSVFVSAAGLREIISKLQHEKKYYLITFLKTIFRDYKESSWSNKNDILMKKVTFEGYSFDLVKIIGDDDDYFYAKPLEKILNYKKLHKAIRKYVSPNNCRPFSSFDIGVIYTGKTTSLPYLKPNTNFINTAGFNELILHSTQPFAKRFKEWLINVMNQLRVDGEYVVTRDAPLDIQQDLATMNNIFGQTPRTPRLAVQPLQTKPLDQLTLSECHDLIMFLQRENNLYKRNIQRYQVQLRQRVTHPADYSLFMLLSMSVVRSVIRFSISRGKDKYIRSIEAKRRKFVAACKQDRSLLSSPQAARYLQITIKKYRTANAAISWMRIRKEYMNFLDDVDFTNRCKTVFSPRGLRPASMDPLFSDRLDAHDDRDSLEWLDPKIADFKGTVERMCDRVFERLDRETNLTTNSARIEDDPSKPGPSNAVE